jgi:hypothetical protein
LDRLDFLDFFDFLDLRRFPPRVVDVSVAAAFDPGNQLVNRDHIDGFWFSDCVSGAFDPDNQLGKNDDFAGAVAGAGSVTGAASGGVLILLIIYYIQRYSINSFTKPI